MTGYWLVPSLDRPHQLKEFFKSYRETESSTAGLILIDKTDFALHHEAYDELDLPINWQIVETDGITMGDKVREIWDRIKDCDWVGILNDDHRPRTHEWDKKIISQIKGFNIVGTNDGPSPDKPWNATKILAGGICYSGKVLRTIGWMFPPGMHHLFHDNVWAILSQRASCGQLLMDVCVEHVHAYIHKNEDETHKKVNSEASWKHDHNVFQEWLKNDSQNDIQKLIAIQPKQGVMIATPTHDSNCFMDFGVGLMDVGMCFSQSNVYFEFARVDGSSLIPHARNSLCDMFLRSKCQKLLFIDSDQGFNRNHVIQLFNSTKPIIAGITPHKRFPLNFNFEPLPHDHEFFPDLCNKSEEHVKVWAEKKADQLGEIEVQRAGSGFLMIDRSVLEIMKEKTRDYRAFDNADNGVRHYEFFKMGQRDGVYRGEDWYFCWLAKSLGIPIFINANVRVTHKGGYVWR